jgi:citrate synthase
MVDNFLNMTFGSDEIPFEQNQIVSKALDTLLVLHADHEQNCSTSTVRLVGSSQANLYASVSAGINALSGPLHGGANEAVIEMLELIHKTSETVETYVERVKNKEDNVRLMGFGHRVYKSFDPRAQIVRGTADQVLSELGVSDPLLEVAKQLEAIALADDYFVSRKLYPNVDFYTGVIYKALGFPPKMFTPLFAIGRMPGWIAHWREMNREANTRISRPQQVYVGRTERSIQI